MRERTPPGGSGVEGGRSDDRSERRQTPKQERGRAAVSAILRATSEILEESGFDSLTTATIARRAGVNIATLYRYFSNKYVIVRELAQALEEERSAAAVEALSSLGAGGDWRASVRLSISAMAELRHTRLGATAIRKALQSSPELWHLDHEVNAATADAIAPFLVRVNPELADERAASIAMTVVHTVASLLDLAESAYGSTPGVLEEIEALVLRYLEPELGAQ